MNTEDEISKNDNIGFWIQHPPVMLCWHKLPQNATTFNFLRLLLQFNTSPTSGVVNQLLNNYFLNSRTVR